MTKNIELEHEMGELTGSIQIRWIAVLSSVTFVIHNQKRLSDVANVHETETFLEIFKDPEISSEISQHIPDDKLNEILKSHIPERAKKKLNSLTDTVLRSALVFGHAILEDVIMQTLMLARKLKPEYFYDLVGEKPVKIREIRSGNFQDALDARVDDWFKALERDSLLSKMKALLSCFKLDYQTVLKGYSYNETRLIEVDSLRHEVVHKSSSRPVVYDDLNFLKRTSIFAAGLLQMSGVGVSVKSIFEGMNLPFYQEKDIVVGGPRDTKTPLDDEDDPPK